tara:strand:+ start:982 stop:1263 length:282 start_codon:yes stop_codon:yes gene_type:complete
MSKEIKFTKEEMDELKSIQDKYTDIQSELGQIQMTKLRFAQQHKRMVERENELSSNFEENQQTEQSFVENVTKKYGDGVLDPTTGKYKLKEDK